MELDFRPERLRTSTEKAEKLSRRGGDRFMAGRHHCGIQSCARGVSVLSVRHYRGSKGIYAIIIKAYYTISYIHGIGLDTNEY
ncbi:hypothetical protein NPIL_492421 [Nephila pilipes]|uniref:Uncharacterized protein n=1 Tax=Nephila pilipes TaxID=299642 RepID=A0A8X6TKF2_NEPPI|nr:hypothetical protein NPIL_492421 [Nephila pilipes]